jgi:mRNA interferase HigB
MRLGLDVLSDLGRGGPARREVRGPGDQEIAVRNADKNQRCVQGLTDAPHELRQQERLKAWLAIVKKAKWQNPPDMQKSFPKADPTKVKSGKTVYIFNIRRNEFRLVCAIHFDRPKVFLLRFMTHAEYEKSDWKNDL